MKIFIISGRNGAGKTTFARFFLKNYPEITHYLNADVLASGLAPLRPELAAVEAGKILLRQMDHLTAQRVSFAFETTLSAKNYLHRIVKWRKAGYDVQLIFFGAANFAICNPTRAPVSQAGRTQHPRRSYCQAL